MKRLIFALMVFILGIVHSCFPQGTRKDDIALTTVGNYLLAVPNASIRVCMDGAVGVPCNPLAQVYSDSALSHPLPNPFTADGSGNYFFYALAANYVIQVSTPGVYTQNDVTLPNLPKQVTTTFNYVLVSFSSTPAFNFTPNTMFKFVLTGNVLSSSLVGNPAPGNVAMFSVCQDSFGGHAFNFPSNFVPPVGFTVDLVPTHCNNLIFTFDGANWQGVGGGGGSGGTDFYQTVQGATVPVTQRSILNFLSPITVTDNPGNSSTDIGLPTFFYQTIQNNAVSLPHESSLNIVPPLVAVDNAANLRTDLTCPTYVGVGGSHSSGCMIDPGASGSATDYPGRDAQWHTSVSASTVKPDTSTGVIYVTTTCNGGSPCSDSNDGLSWGTAKLTPYAALLALPNGATSPPTAGNGIVYVANNLNGIPFGGPVGATSGWWMFGPTDPNYSAGKTGWMRAPTVGSVSMECLAPTVGSGQLAPTFCQEFWGGHTDNVHPAIWFNGFAGGVSLKGFGFNYEATGFKLGVDSNNAYGTGGLSSALFDHVSFNPGNCYSGIGAGPGVDISGATFWVTFSHSAFGGCVTQDYSISSISRSSGVVTVTLTASGTGDIVAGNSQNIIIRNVTDPTFDGAFAIQSASGTSLTFNQLGPNATSSGGQAFPYGAAAIGEFLGGAFVYLDDVSLGSGGVWMQGGFNGVGLTAKNITYEGSGHPDMSIFEYLPMAGFVNSFVDIDDVQFADNTVPICGVEGLLPGNITVQNTSVCGSLTTLGSSLPATTLVSPLRQGMHGIYNAHSIAINSDSARSMFSPYSVRFANTTVGFTSGSWTTTGLTVTNGISDPAGTTNATRMANTSGGQQIMNFGGSFGTTPQLGSFYIYGVWLRSETPGVLPLGPTFDMNGSGLGAGDYCQGGSPVYGANVSSPSYTGDGQWGFWSGICKIITNPSGGNQRLDMYISNNTTIDAYGPTMLIVPAGSISDNDAWELANNLQSYPDGVPAGDVVTMPNQRFSTNSFAIRSSGFTSTLSGGTLTANRAVTPADASGVNAVIGGSITGTKCLHTVGTTGQIQETNADCGTGSGGGTINPSQQFSGPYYSGAGSSTTQSGFPPPVTNGFWQYGWNVTAGAAVQPNSYQVGMGGAGVSGATSTYLITYADNATTITHSQSASASVIATLPTAITLGNPSFVFSWANHSPNADTIAATSWTIQVGTAAPASSYSVTAGAKCTFKVDPSGTNWVGDCYTPGSSSILFSNVTPSTNTQGALLIGTGASLGTTGTGTIAATTSTVASNLVGCTPVTPGSFCYWNGSAYTLLAGNTSGSLFLSETSAGVPSWQAGSGGGVSSSTLTINVLPKASGTSSITNSSVSDNGVTVTTVEPISVGGVTLTGSGPIAFGGTEGAVASCPVAVAGSDFFCGNSTTHRWMSSNNGQSPYLPVMQNPMTAAGDIIYGGTVTNGIAFETRLAAGTSSQVFIGGTVPSWGTLNLATMVSGTLSCGNLPAFTGLVSTPSGSCVTAVGLIPPVNGGTGVANPLAHGIAVAEFTAAYNYVTPGFSGQTLISLSGQDPIFAPQGLPGRFVTTTLDQIRCDQTTYSGGQELDRATQIIYNSASAVAVTLPQAGSTGCGGNFSFDVINEGAGTVTITPTISTLTSCTGGACSTGALALTTGQYATVNSPDNVNYFSVVSSTGGGGGSGTVGSCATTGALAIYTAATTTGCGNADFTYATHTLTSAAAGLVDLSAITATTGFKVPIHATNTATAAGVIDFDSTNTNLHSFIGGADAILSSEASAIASGVIPKSTSSTVALLGASLLSDNGTTATYTGTGGLSSAGGYTSTGSTAGVVDLAQGPTNSGAVPCTTATSICEQAPTAVTSYVLTKPGVSANGVITNNVASAVITQGFSGDANHSAVVTTGSGTSIGSTQLCSSVNCPAGTYRVNVYIDITTACGTSGTYIVNLIYTDDQGAKTVPVNINGTGTVPSTGTLTTTSTSNFGENAQILRLTSGSINYSTTAAACGTAGPMVGKLYLSVEPVQ